MKLWNVVSLLVIGALAAMGQIMWTHGDHNRLGEYAFELAILFILAPMIASGIIGRYRSWRAARQTQRQARADAARQAAEREKLSRFHRRESWRQANLDAIGR